MRYASLHPEERSILISLRTKGHWEESDKQVPAIFSPVYYTYSYSWPITFLHNGPLIIKPSIKILRSVSLGLSFLKKASSLSHEMVSNCMFFSVKFYLYLFNFQIQPETLRWWRKVFLSYTLYYYIQSILHVHIKGMWMYIPQ